MKPGILAVIVVAIIVAIGGFLYIASDDSNDDTVSGQQSAESSAPQAQTNESDLDNQQPVASDGFSAEEVASHSTEDDCWTIIDGNVYDLTTYIPRHQGGDEILRACGVDGSSLFNQRKTDSGEQVGSGTPHSSNAARQLESLKIGELLN